VRNFRGTGPAFSASLRHADADLQSRLSPFTPG
jgi:hypothetical protein